MLRGIRNASANWLGKAVMAAVMGLLIVSFAIWGIGDIFRGFGRSSLAKIGSTEISAEQFRVTYNDRLQQLSRRIGRPLTADQARALGLERQLLGQLITEIALDERAHQLGLGLSDAEIAKRITEDPGFRGVFGQFDRLRFEQLIRSAGYTEARYVAEQRRVLLRRQIAETVGGELVLPKTLIEAISRYEGEERSIEFATLDRAVAGDIPPPTPEALAKYFEDRKASFRAPEYRKLVVLTLTPADSARWITVSDADARQIYDDRRVRYVTPERRQIRQIIIPNAADARAASERIKQGLSFEALAAERGLKPGDIDLGLLAKTAILDRAVADAAFSLKQGEVSDPIEGRFGTALISVAKIEPEHVRDYQEVAAEIKREVAVERGKAEVATLHDKIEDERAAGSQLSEVAKKLNLTPQLIEAVDRSGRDPGGNAVADLPAGVDVLSNAFSSDVGVENDPLQIPGSGYVWFEVAEITPSRERDLDEVKDQFEVRWRDEQIAERLKSKAAELVEKLKTGASLADVSAHEKLKVENASGLKRGKSSESLSAKVVEQAFRTAKGAPSAAEGGSATEWVVFRVTEVKQPSLDTASAEGKKIADTLRQSYSDDILGQYVMQLQNDLGVSINQTVLRQVIGGETN